MNVLSSSHFFSEGILQDQLNHPGGSGSANGITETGRFQDPHGYAIVCPVEDIEYFKPHENFTILTQSYGLGNREIESESFWRAKGVASDCAVEFVRRQKRHGIYTWSQAHLDTVVSDHRIANQTYHTIQAVRERTVTVDIEGAIYRKGLTSLGGEDPSQLPAA